MKTLYLHIGLGKTGTSYLQHVLAKNEKALLQQGVLYARSHTTRQAAKGEISSGNGKLLLETTTELEKLLYQHNNKEDIKKYALCFSTEYLAKNMLSAELHHNINYLAQINGFTKIRILLLVRNPIEHAASGYQQVCKRNTHKFKDVSVEGFFNQYEYAIRIANNALKFKEMTSFEVEYVVLNYSTIKHNLISALYQWLPLERVDLVSAVQRVNRSLTRSELALQKMLIEKLGEKHYIFSDFLSNQLPDIAPEIVYPSEQVQKALYQRLEPEINKLNQHIAKEHQLCQELFHKTPQLEQTLNMQQVQVLIEYLEKNNKQEQRVFSTIREGKFRWTRQAKISRLFKLLNI